ncbi:MAG TPA: hypothetical protein VHW23_21050 [Kofleriaceae bacterium]|nr:hypothetical protein [Kofleriaceae bacterium]
MLAGCVVTADAPSTEAAGTTSAETTSTASDELALAPEITPRLSCDGVEQACATGPVCHHQEGRNIGVLGCPAGTICCQF